MRYYLFRIKAKENLLAESSFYSSVVELWRWVNSNWIPNSQLIRLNLHVFDSILARQHSDDDITSKTLAKQKTF